MLASRWISVHKLREDEPQHLRSPSAASQDPWGDHREPTTSIPQSQSARRDQKCLFLSLSLVPVKKCVTLKFDTTRQLLGDSAGEDKSWSGSDAQNNGARHRRLRDPRRKSDHGLEDTQPHLRGRPGLTRTHSRDWCTHAKTKRQALIFHSGRGTYGPEELDLILSFSTFSHGCKGARSAASAGSAPLWILAYS